MVDNSLSTLPVKFAAGHKEKQICLLVGNIKILGLLIKILYLSSM